MGGQVKDPYFNAKRAKIILFSVLLVHICIIIVPLIYASLTEFFDPPLIVMKVGLADLPLGDSPDAGQPAPASKTSEPDPVSVDDIPVPQKPDPLPPEPKIEPKKTEPAPQKTEPKKTEPAPQKTEPKKDPPKTEPKKDPPKSNLLKPEDIIKPKNTRTQAQIDAERKAREAAEAKAKADAKARQELIAGIQNDASQPGKFGTTNPGQEGILATKEMREYYEQLNAFIRPKWNAVSPSSIELSGKISNWPVVELTISRKGEVTASIFVSQSGNKKIDDAVKLLLADLKVVPVPPQAAKIRVTLDIR